MQLRYPTLRFHLEHDAFVVWLRWVSMEKPPSPDEPSAQGIRVELLINRNSVLGPTIVYRRDLEEPVYLRANQVRTAEVLGKAAEKGIVDLTLVIHGSIAHAPYAALYQVTGHEGEAIGSAGLPGTPLMQIQPSTPPDRWHVAAQASLRATLELEGRPVRLRVLKS